MNFDYSDDQELAHQNVVRFAQSLNPTSGDEESTEFPWNQWHKFAEFGLLGLTVPEEFGGGGLSCLDAAIVLDGLGFAYHDHGLVHAICTQNLCAVHIHAYGTDEQKSNLLPGICGGKIVAAQAITEPGAGSDVAAIKTSAIRQDNGDYLLNGSKVFITNGPIANVVIVYAVSDPKRKVLGRTSCFIILGEQNGFTRGTPFQKMGLASLQNGELFFSDCRVPEDAVLGKPGGASAMFADAMNWERVLLFATFVGKLERMLGRCVEYARTRKQFGETIGSFQAVSSKIADMRVNLELSRLVTHKAAWMIDQGRSVTLEAAITKLFSSESCKQACLDAVQIHGGYGYMREGGIERELRDCMAGTIYSGTSEIQRMIIAKLCGI